MVAALAEWAPTLQSQFPQAEHREVLHEPEVYPYGYVLRLPASTHSNAALGAELARLGESVALLAADLPRSPTAPGETITLPLRWHVLAPLPKPLNVFVHLGEPHSPPLAGADGPPCGDTYTTDRWHADEIIEHQVALALPPDLAPGTYSVFAGMYDWVTGERLAVAQANGVEPDRVLIGTLTVE